MNPLPACGNWWAGDATPWAAVKLFSDDERRNGARAGGDDWTVVCVESTEQWEGPEVQSTLGGLVAGTYMPW